MELEELERDAKNAVEFIERDLWPRATDAQRLRLCKLLAVIASLSAPKCLVEFVPRSKGEMNGTR
jgi:hypothetical protein